MTYDNWKSTDPHRERESDSQMAVDAAIEGIASIWRSQGVLIEDAPDLGSDHWRGIVEESLREDLITATDRARHLLDLYTEERT